jgi:glycosyltransferase involved in cell wall biosynthesis
MKLLFVCPYYPPYSVGGAEESTFALAAALRERGHDVRVLALRMGPELPATDVPVETVDVGLGQREPGRPLRPRQYENPLVQWRVARRVRLLAAEADLVHCQTTHLLPAAYAGARLARVPIVATIRDLDAVCPLSVCLLEHTRVPRDCGLRRLERTCVPEFASVYGHPSRARLSASSFVFFLTARLRAALLRRCAAVYAVGSDLGPLHVAAGLLREGSVEVLPNIANAGDVSPNGRGAYAVYAGKVSPGKGATYLLDAVERVRAEEPAFRLVVAGYAAEPTRTRLVATAGVDWLGRVPRARVLDLYRSARYAVVPSVWPEPFPRAALEAAAAGLPVVATRAGGTPDVVEDGRTGVLVAPRSATELAAAMLQLWRDPARCRELGGAARRAVETRFSADAICGRAESLYARVLESA